MYLSLCISLGRRPRPHPCRRLGFAPAGETRRFWISFMQPQIKAPGLEEGDFPPSLEQMTLEPWLFLPLVPQRTRRGALGDTWSLPRGRPDPAPEWSESRDSGPASSSSPTGPARRRSRVRGLGPHERRPRCGLQPREHRHGFKRPQRTNPCYPAGRPWPRRHLACLLRLAAGARLPSP